MCASPKTGLQENKFSNGWKAIQDNADMLNELNKQGILTLSATTRAFKICCGALDSSNEFSNYGAHNNSMDVRAKQLVS